MYLSGMKSKSGRLDMRENIRKELQPGTSWRNGFAVRHIRSVTRSKTGVPTQIEEYEDGRKDDT